MMTEKKNLYHFSWIVLFFTIVFALPELSAAASAQQIISSLSKEVAQKTQPVEDKSGAMNHFYEALARTAAKQGNSVTRISHFGDSLIEMELFPGPARRNFQKKFGDSGHGFVLPSRPRPWYRPYDVTLEPAAEWICMDMGVRNEPDRKFGLGGARCYSARDKKKTKIGTKKGAVGSKVSSFELLLPLEPQGGEIRLKVDGKDYGTVNTHSTNYNEGYAVVRVPSGSHELQMTSVKKGTRVHGVILEADGPGVVYDALGINGSGVKTYLSVDGERWMNQIRHRNPDLLIIGIGTNDVYPGLDVEVYKQDLRKLIGRAKKAAPNASILFMAPLDRALKKGSQLITNPVTPKVVAAQREVAREMKIAFWSAFDAMGGEGSMARWYRAKPRLGAGDFFHPTPKGGEVLGEMFYNAVMQGFVRYLKQNGLPGPAPARAADPLVEVQIQK